MTIKNFKTIMNLVIIFFCILQSRCSTKIEQADKILRIMYLGDSITQGALGGDCTYTTYLTDTLTKRNIHFELIGSVSEWGILHEGHSGWRADSILKHISSWTAGNTPDVVLCHLGTNDLEHEHDVDIDSVINRTAGEIEAIVDTIRYSNPNASFFIAQIIPHQLAIRSAIFQRYNHKLAERLQRKSKTNSPVFIVDHFKSFSAENDLGDGVHPNKSGALKMAQTWLAALDSSGVLIY